MKRKKYFYILYMWETEIPVALFETVEELKVYLGYKTLNSAKAAICHIVRGDNKFVRDENNQRYKLRRFDDFDDYD